MHAHDLRSLISHRPPCIPYTFTQAHHEGHWERRDVLGVHDQKQPGLCWVGSCVPSGRLQANDFDEYARLAEVSGDVCLGVAFAKWAPVCLLNAFRPITYMSPCA